MAARLKRYRRMGLMRNRERMHINRTGARDILRYDFAIDRELRSGAEMFNTIEVGQIVVIETFGFPHVGILIEKSDTSIVLKDAVRILYDGRHGDFAKGAKFVPSTAEIEATYPLYEISADDVRACAPYPGKKIPEPK